MSQITPLAVYLLYNNPTAKRKNGKFGNAEVEYQKATKENEQSFEANFNLGDAFFRQEKFEEADELFANLSNVTADKDKLAKTNKIIKK